MKIPTYRVEVRTIDGCIGTIDIEGAGEAFVQVQPVPPYRHKNDPVAAIAARQAVTVRLAACWNACADMVDPVAEIAAMRAKIKELTK